MPEKKEKLLALRHSTEHVLTQAMYKLFPEIKMAMGPATDDGFYFDFDPQGVKISEEDLPKIEAEMKKIIGENLPIVREEISIDQAKKLFSGNLYKLEWISEIAARKEPITVYKTGESFVDLCAGPHVVSTGKIGAFKLLSVAGAYWHGNEKNVMLTRIYGTAFFDQNSLNKFLEFKEEAKKRDHKVLGPKLDLFTFSELVGAGLPLWTPKGTLLRNLLDEFVWSLRKEKGYMKVSIPHITKKDLYIKSGHWKKFSQELFKITTRENHEFAMKPMNCPHHTQIFAYKLRSYRELPQRYAETTMVYRDEQSGELSGLSRVRCITQDDAHVFCRESQLQDEVYAIWDIIEAFYSKTGFPDLTIRLSLHDPKQMDKYLGNENQWEHAENQLRTIIKNRGKKCVEAVGEAAFYGPKIDFIAKDSLGREWQVATIQVDRNMPENFDLYCINEKGNEERVVMIHAAIMGSIERFLSILIEHFAGAFPLWLSPVQVSIIPISDNHAKYAQIIAQQLIKRNIRVEVSDKADTMQSRIKEAQMQKIPYMVILGDREMTNTTVSLRKRNGTQKQGVIVNDFLKEIENEIIQKNVE